MRTAGVLGALTAALVLQAALSGLSLAAGTRVNLVLVVVVYAALAYGPVGGLLTGAVGGLAQDALAGGVAQGALAGGIAQGALAGAIAQGAGGVIGVGGLSKTFAGFLVGVLGAQFIVSQPLPRFVMFVGATFAHELFFQGLDAVVESRPFTMHFSATLVQAAVNGAVGILAFFIVEKGPEMLQRRQSRPAYGRRRF